MNTHTVSLQLNSEQEKASLSFKLSLKKIPHIWKFKIALHKSPDERYHLYYMDKESCRL